MKKRFLLLFATTILVLSSFEVFAQTIGTGSGNNSMFSSAEGKVYIWGSNSDGQLGNNSTTDSNVLVEVDVSGVLSGKTITAVATGFNHTIALDSDGKVYTWGDNEYGQLGNNSNTDSDVPVDVDVSGVLSGKTITAVAAGMYHSIALDSEGKVYTWGSNQYGQLGNNSNVVKAAPVAVYVSGVLSGKTIDAVAAGMYHSIALDLEGKVYTWGSNQYGQLGNNSNTDSNVPVKIIIFPPLVTTDEVSIIGSGKADCGGNVTSDKGYEVTARGVCWSTSQNPTTSDTKTTDGTGTGVFTSSITGLSSGQQYYVRAYATNLAGTSYGEQRNFTNNFPDVTTKIFSNITMTSVNCGGNVTAEGGYSVTARGVCYSTSSNPTTSNLHTTDGEGVGEFTSEITGLSGSTLYYFRAYAISSIGTSYGEQRSIETDPGPPSVSTSSVTNIGNSSADCGGNVTSSNGSSPTSRGVCWRTSQNPTTSDTKTTDGTGTGEFTSSITGLSLGTQYYVRAYAKNYNGTSYGEERSFTTVSEVPLLSTSSVTFIGVTTAVCGGNVTSDQGASVTDRGVCWSTSQNPTTSDTKITDGAGTGEFESSITGLEKDTKYYTRAYAVNSAGTAYGEEKEFVTRSELLNQLNFDRFDDNVTTSITLPDQGTIEFWFNPNAYQSTRTLWQTGSPSAIWYLRISDNDLHCGIGSSSYISIDNCIESNKWHHVAVTWNKQNLLVEYALYLNGDLEGAILLSNSQSWVEPGDILSISSESTPFDGQIDEFRIWNTVKSFSEIQLGMHKSIDPSSENLICYYDSDIINGSTLFDRTTNGYDGVLQNMTNDCWQTQTAPFGEYGICVRTDAPTSTGSIGKTISADMATLVSGSYLGIYSIGEGSSQINTETFPDGISQRADIIWGVYEFGNVTADLVIDYTNLTNLTNQSALKLLKRADATSNWTDITASETQNTTNHTFTLTGQTEFSEFSIGDGGENGLPVELLSFTANVIENEVVLNWSTATEMNNYGFEIQRHNQESSIKNQDENNPSVDGWETLGFVEGHGNSNSPKDYSYIDATPLSRIAQFRLKQIDTDGTFEYSKIIEVEIDLPTKFELAQNYPNPFNPSTTIKYSIPNNVVIASGAKQSIKIATSSGENVPKASLWETPRNDNTHVQLKIYNTLGEEVATLVNKNQSPGRYEVEFEANKLTSGVYIYRLVCGKFILSKKLMLLK